MEDSGLGASGFGFSTIPKKPPKHENPQGKGYELAKKCFRTFSHSRHHTGGKRGLRSLPWHSKQAYPASVAGHLEPKS